MVGSREFSGVGEAPLHTIASDGLPGTAGTPIIGDKAGDFHELVDRECGPWHGMEWFVKHVESSLLDPSCNSDKECEEKSFHSHLSRRSD